jgi:hypothetical protein
MKLNGDVQPHVLTVDLNCHLVRARGFGHDRFAGQTRFS